MKDYSDEPLVPEAGAEESGFLEVSVSPNYFAVALADWEKELVANVSVPTTIAGFQGVSYEELIDQLQATSYNQQVQITALQGQAEQMAGLLERMSKTMNKAANAIVHLYSEVHKIACDCTNCTVDDE